MVDIIQNAYYLLIRNQTINIFNAKIVIAMMMVVVMVMIMMMMIMDE